MIKIPLVSWSAAITAAIIGASGTLALIIAAAQAVGATPIQTASWITNLCLAIGLGSIVLSWRYKMPIVTAWSAAGLAMIGASSGFTMHSAVGAFIVAAILLAITGLVKPLTRLVAKMPPSIASGMLAGILIGFPIQAAKDAALDPLLILPLVAVFFIARRLSAGLASMTVLIAGIAYAFALGRIEGAPILGFATFEWVSPVFDIGAIIGLALPLYIVTMASQNLPGLAVLRSNDYHPPAGPLISITGFIALLTAPFCASTTNLSALTASICVNPEANPNRDQRWITGIAYGICYFIFAAFGASITGIVAVLPFDLITLVAGLALLAPLMGALNLALADEQHRLSAIVTLTVTASGVSAFGIGAAFWGIIAGLIVYLATKSS